MGGTLQEERERRGGLSPGPLGPGSLLSSQIGTPHSKAPSRTHGSWGHMREAGEIRRGRWEGPSGRSRREVEGDCPAHLGMGSLLSSHSGPLLSRTPSRLRGFLGA